GLRDPEPVRDRVRAGLRRAVPEPALRGDPARIAHARGGLGRWWTERQIRPGAKGPRVPCPWRLRESLLPQRVLPAHRDRPARLAGEPDADPQARAHEQGDQDVLGPEDGGPERPAPDRRG